MLRKTLNTAVVGILGAGTLVATAGTALACPPDFICSGAHGGTPGGGGGGGSNGGGGGPTGPPTCPPPVIGNCGANIPPPAAPVHVPTIDVADAAAAQEPLGVPSILTSPKVKSYVALRTYLWIPGGEFQPVHAQAAVPEQTVTATATPQFVTWNLGNGTDLVCHTAGGVRGSCSYVYPHSSADQPGGTYQVTATITWAITWTCAGDCDEAAGDLPDMTSPPAVRALPVGEIQTESSPG